MAFVLDNLPGWPQHPSSYTTFTSPAQKQKIVHEPPTALWDGEGAGAQPKPPLPGPYVCPASPH